MKRTSKNKSRARLYDAMMGTGKELARINQEHAYMML